MNSTENRIGTPSSMGPVGCETNLTYILDPFLKNVLNLDILQKMFFIYTQVGIVNYKNKVLKYTENSI